MATLDQRLVESNIFENSIEGLRTIIGRVAANYGEPPVRTVVVSAAGFEQREMAQKFGGQITYPFIGLAILRVTRNPNSYNNNLRRTGITITVNNKQLTYKLTPVVATVRMRYFTQDNGDLIKFSRRWLMRQNDAQYKIANDKFNINIQVRLSDDLNVPDLSINDWGNIYQLESDCEISTYLGEIETNTKISQVNLTTNLWDRTKQLPLASQSWSVPLKPRSS